MAKLKGCICSLNDKGERVDQDGLPLWIKMSGCPACDPQCYTPTILPKLTPQEARK